ncbi:hypothetical protein PpBr36_08891 [Pyricularia pennisetigena]|nr:hypothetical protein PpBr36_08891 [Pyricularia pennisetigena]TLS24693.1 hypothetical protein PpBr36_08891 [Pyricularia pennisetigena]
MAMPGTMTAGPRGERDICATPAVQSIKAMQLQAAAGLADRMEA